ncbi:MAG TPA: carboxylesterase/lipase family protein [Myxococcota bacterium]|nr:carboxylesterase/lipase family protein [Myxococcota bacterium]
MTATATATTQQGRVLGEEHDGVSIFRGIPYAKPPVGALRWRAPQPPEPWSGVRDCTQFGPCAPQNLVVLDMLEAFKITEPQSEDCLYLNVWTPRADAGRRPVLVWIHGGAFTIGSGAQTIYDGEALAKRGDVVVVTINYRLGPLGFLRLDEATGGAIPSTGSEGILDQVAALRWVRENIAEFGGDPDNVTIFGESAGGMSVGTLLGVPQARGLFHKAIPQSGASSTAATAEQAAFVAGHYLTQLGVGKDPSALLAATTEQLLAASAALAGPPGTSNDAVGGLPFQPTIDGDVLPRLAIESIAEGSAAGVPILIGSTLEEWKLFLPADPSNYTLTEEGLLRRLERRLGPGARGLVDSYRKSRSERGLPVTPVELWGAVETDRIFRMPALQLAETQAAHEPRVYSYLFTWSSPILNGMLGSCHALELGFVFGTHASPGMADFSGSGAEADALAEHMMDAWLAFARTGDPSTAAAGRWHRYDVADRHTRIFGAETKLEPAPYDEERRAWGSVPVRVIGAV